MLSHLLHKWFKITIVIFAFIVFTESESFAKIPSPAFEGYFTFASNTGRSYSILICSATIKGNNLEIGDEIGVFDTTATGDTICVGAVIYEGSDTLGLSAWQDNPETSGQDGYVSGNTMIFKIYDASSGIVYPAGATYSSGDGTFENGAYAIISALTTINRDPVIKTMIDTTMKEGDTFTRQVHASDLDGDNLTYSLTSFPSVMTIGSSSGEISFTPTYTQSDVYTVTVKAVDGNGGEDSKSFTLTVTDVNRDPVITAMTDTTMKEGDTFTRQVYASDLDGDNLTYSLTSFPSGMTIGSSTGEISFTPTYTQSDVYTVTVKAVDSKGGEDSKSFILTVTDVNRKPAITAMTDTTMKEGDTFTRQVYASDLDGDNLTYSLTSFPSGMTIGSSTGQISFTPTYTQSAVYTVTVKAEDGRDGEDSDSFALTVTNVNRDPVITAMTDTTMKEGDTFTRQVYASDLDGDNLTYSLTYFPSGMTIGSSSGQISFTPTYAQSDVYTVTVKAGDGKGGEDSKSFTLTVTDVNRDPVITTMIDTTMKEGDIFTRQVYASDLDNDPITYSLTSKPTGMTIGSSSGQISFTPTYTQSDVYTVTVKAEDGRDGEDSDSFALTVTNVNRDPVITAMTDTTMKEGDTFTRQVYASDLDGDNLTYSLTYFPSGMTIGSSSGQISFTPTYAQSDVYTVTVKAGDGKGGEDSKSFTLTVTDVNRDPAITAMIDTTMKEGDTFTRQVYASDLDGDNLTYSLTSFPSGMTIGSSSGEISFTPTYTQTAVYTVTVKAVDGKGGEDTKSFTLTVVNVNRKPVIITTTLSNAVEGSPYSDTLLVNDPDIGETLTFEILTGPDWLSVVANDSLGILTGTPANDDVGSDIPLSIKVEDSGGLSDTLNTTITVFTNTTHFVFTANTGFSYSIVIDSVIFTDLSVGDEIGVFDGLLCVGAVRYDGSFPIGLAAWKDDPQTGTKDGYTDSNPMTFKFYDESAQEELNVSADYTIGDGKFGTETYSQLTLNILLIQTISLNTGWNLISSYVSPDDPSIDQIAQSIAESLAIIQNDDGDFYVPILYDGIGTWNIFDAYYVYMLQSVDLEISGSQIPLSTPILLDSLWNYVPNYNKSLTPIATAVSSLGTNLVIVQNDDGEFYIPGEYDGIGNLEPGEGYLMYLSSAGSLVYDSQSASSKVSTSPPLLARHYAFTSNTGGSYSILINSVRFEGNDLEANDEIGVFDITESGDTLCVGAAVFEDSYPVGLAAWIDNTQTTEQDGYMSGHTMIFKVYDASSGIEYNTIAAYELGEGKFSDGAYTKITMLTTTAPTNVQDNQQVITEYKLFSNYPNPFNPETVIGFQIPKSSFVTLKIYNTIGQLVKTLVSDNLDSGIYEFTWSGINESGQRVSSGLYIYHVQAGEFSRVKKMLLIK